MPKRPIHRQPGLVDPPNQATTDRAQQTWQTQLTQILRTGLGQSRDQSGKFLTWDDLETEGIVEKASTASGSSSSGYVPGTGQIPEEDRSPPPAPRNVEADGAMTCIYITWDKPSQLYDYRVEIYRSAIDDVGTASLAGSGTGTIYQDVVGSDKTTYYYWVRFIRQLSMDIIIGPWNQTEGTPGSASEDPEWVLEQVSGKFDTEDLKTQVFAVDLFGVKSSDPAVEQMAFVIDTTVDPPMVAMDGASIVKASIGDAKIANLNVDKLVGGTADFVEANILEGSITNAKIGNVIQSDNYLSQAEGWHINKGGYAEFEGAYFRGTIEGSVINGSELNGTNVNGGTVTGSTIIGSTIYSSDQVWLADPWGDGRVVYYDQDPTIPISVVESFSQIGQTISVPGNTIRRHISSVVSAGYKDGILTNIRYRWQQVKKGFSWRVHIPGHNKRYIKMRIVLLDPFSQAYRAEGGWKNFLVDSNESFGQSASDTVAGVVWSFSEYGYVIIQPRDSTFNFGSPTDDMLNGQFACEVDTSTSSDCYLTFSGHNMSNTVHP